MVTIVKLKYVPYAESFYDKDTGMKYTYHGVKIPLYGLNDQIVDYLYEKFIKTLEITESLKTRNAIFKHANAQSMNEGSRSYGAEPAADDKLKFLAEYKVGRKILSEFVKAYSSTHFAADGVVKITEFDADGACSDDN